MGTGNDSKVRVADVPVRIVKLRVVEHVEEFGAQVESDGFCYEGPLGQAEIGVVESWAVEEPAIGSSERTECTVLHKCAKGRHTGIWELGRRRRGRYEVTTGVIARGTVRIRFARV